MISSTVFCPQSLALEVEGTGVVIQEMDPGAVNTEMTKVILTMNPTDIGDPDEMVMAKILETMIMITKTNLTICNNKL